MEKIPPSIPKREVNTVNICQNSIQMEDFVQNHSWSRPRVQVLGVRIHSEKHLKGRKGNNFWLFCNTVSSLLSHSLCFGSVHYKTVCLTFRFLYLIPLGPRYSRPTPTPWIYTNYNSVGVHILNNPKGKGKYTFFFPWLLFIKWNKNLEKYVWFLE